MLDRDIRGTELYREALDLYNALRQPGSGQIFDASEVHVSSDGQYSVFSGALMFALEGLPPTRICRVDLTSGDLRVMTFGPHNDRHPRYSPDGRRIAFLSDRLMAGDFQVYLMETDTGAARAIPHVDGTVEYLQWSPDGRRVLMGVAGYGADTSGTQGAVTHQAVLGETLPWMPVIATGQESHHWRQIWVFEIATGRLSQVSGNSSNVWEASWCGNQLVAAVVSDGPGEGQWYSARLQLLDVSIGTVRNIHAPCRQLGCPAGSPSGAHLSIVEALCSDRWLVAGDLYVIETGSGASEKVQTGGVDVTYSEWRSDRTLLLAGHRDLHTVVGIYDVVARSFSEIWSSDRISTVGRYASVSGLNAAGDCVLAAEGFDRAPEIALISKGRYQVLRSFGLERDQIVAVPEKVDVVRWHAPDGLEIHGWLLQPRAKRPHPLVMCVHGGPVWHWRPTWLGRWNVFMLLLLKRGYAVFLPNPRGSSGRGQEFAERVVGDLGGGDASDCLSGVDHLVHQGIADSKRLGVTGISYGGFMTSWLITQDDRFAAAIPVAPTTNYVTQHLISNIPGFDSLFMADTYTNPTGKYFARSPIMHARGVRTPTLNVCGGRDRCTPPEEAVQFHNALLELDVESVLVTYPEEGHGIRALPAAIDYAARVVGWLEVHLETGGLS